MNADEYIVDIYTDKRATDKLCTFIVAALNKADAKREGILLAREQFGTGAYDAEVYRLTAHRFFSPQ
jgi:hypothetical protein